MPLGGRGFGHARCSRGGRHQNVNWLRHNLAGERPHRTGKLAKKSASRELLEVRSICVDRIDAQEWLEAAEIIQEAAGVVVVRRKRHVWKSFDHAGEYVRVPTGNAVIGVCRLGFSGSSRRKLNTQFAKGGQVLPSAWTNAICDRIGPTTTSPETSLER